MAENGIKKNKAKGRSREWWAKQVADCERSGMALRDYAKTRGLNLDNLYNWRGKLRKSTQTCIEKAQTAPMRFVEVINKNSFSKADSVEFESPRGWKVRLPAETGSDAISKILQIMEERS